MRLVATQRKATKETITFHVTVEFTPSDVHGFQVPRDEGGTLRIERALLELVKDSLRPYAQ
jgi:hypothetical protein